ITSFLRTLTQDLDPVQTQRFKRRRRRIPSRQSGTQAGHSSVCFGLARSVWQSVLHDRRIFDIVNKVECK
ncbi:hypothetical protein, partial [Azospirillum griseum]|uniref:hypothetical protein n=1 Tax=Azospirillum griseum TaxID=2496639 RepID=UPI001AEC9692